MTYDTCCVDAMELRRTKSMPRVGSGYNERTDPSYNSSYRVCGSIWLLVFDFVFSILFDNYYYTVQHSTVL